MSSNDNDDGADGFDPEAQASARRVREAFAEARHETIEAIMDRVEATRVTDRPARLEAFGWLFAAEVGIIDGIGGTEWRRQCTSGGVSSLALAVINEVEGHQTEEEEP